MKKPQYLTIIVAVAGLCLLWIFGKTTPGLKPQSGAVQAHTHEDESSSMQQDVLSSSFSIDSALEAIKKNVPRQNAPQLDLLEAAASKAGNNEQKIHAYHRLSQFWKDTVRAFIPYAWYTAEGARLENSEKNLNFAGHLFLNNLQQVDDDEIRRWMALQAKDLLERSLKINPDNDSAKVGLGSAYIFGGISNAPMQGIAKIREVVDKDSSNIYAQMTLAMGALMSGQTDKARERLETITRLDAKNIQAALLLADIFERQGDKQNAIKWYEKALPLAADHTEMKEELQKRIASLKQQK